MPDAMHISSLLLRSVPDRMPDVIAHVTSVEGAEVALTDPEGKIIVTMETASEGHIVDALTEFQLIDGVVSAALVFHQIDKQSPSGSADPGQPTGDMT